MKHATRNKRLAACNLTIPKIQLFFSDVGQNPHPNSIDKTKSAKKI